jgi:hypothetical protein
MQWIYIMQLLGSEPVVNTVSRSPWLFESKSYEAPVKGGGKKKNSKYAKRKSKANRRNKSIKNKTRRRMPRIYN